MKTVLITGGFGAGKSTVLRLLSENSLYKLYPPSSLSVFKADEKAKELLRVKSPCYPSLRDLFPSVFTANGEIDQKKLSSEIFSQPEKRKALQKLIHPMVRKSFQQFVIDQKQQDKELVFCETPLISKNIFDFCEFQVLISCPKAERTKRLLKLGWLKRDIDRRMQAQIPENEVTKRVDFIIDNSHSIENLKTEVKKFLALHHAFTSLNKKR